MDRREVAQAVELWIEGVRRRRSTGEQKSLLDAYRAFGEAWLPPALALGADDDIGAKLAGAEGALLRRTSASVVAAASALGRPIADVLEDMSLFGLSVARVLVQDEDDDAHVRAALTALTRAEHAIAFGIRAVVRSLEDRTRRLEEENERTLATMAELLSHELRNRLGAARTAAETMQSPDVHLDPDMIHRGSGVVVSSVDDALRTVEDVRALVAREANLSEPDQRQVRLSTLVRAVIEDSTTGIPDHPVELQVYEPLLDVGVDARRLRLIVFNLVQNAVKNFDPSRSPPRVSISTRLDDEQNVVLEVADNGVGIDQERLADIFKPYVRLDPSRDTSGSGLGLWIVAQAVDQLGGDIGVRSSPGHGTTFTVTWPLEPGRANEG